MKKKPKNTSEDLDEVTPTLSENQPPQGEISLDVQKVREFELYCIWRALPPFWKGLTEAELVKKYYIDDPQLVELLQLVTQEDFSQKYDVHRDTLTDWNKKIKARNIMADIKLWVDTVLKNVMASTYRSAMSKDPKAHQDRKLMMQFGGWMEKIGVNHQAEGLAELIKQDLGIK